MRRGECEADRTRLLRQKWEYERSTTQEGIEKQYEQWAKDPKRQEERRQKGVLSPEDKLARTRQFLGLTELEDGHVVRTMPYTTILRPDYTGQLIERSFLRDEDVPPRPEDAGLNEPNPYFCAVPPDPAAAALVWDGNPERPENEAQFKHRMKVALQSGFGFPVAPSRLAELTPAEQMLEEAKAGAREEYAKWERLPKSPARLDQLKGEGLDQASWDARHALNEPIYERLWQEHQARVRKEQGEKAAQQAQVAQGAAPAPQTPRPQSQQTKGPA